MKLWKKMLIGVGLGVVAGLVLGPKASYLKPIGSVFLGLLSMLVVPLMFSSMTMGIASVRDTKKLGRISMKTLLMFAATTAIAIVIGLAFARLFNPGAGIGLTYDSSKVAVDESPELLKLFMSIIPTNPIAAFASANILQVIVFAAFVGFAINLAGEKGKPVAKVIESLSEVMFAMTSMVMKLAPYGLFGLMAWVAGSFGVAILVPLLKLLLAHYLACIFHLVVVFGFILVFMAKVSPTKFFKGMTDAITLAASTSSSSATLPASLHCVQENLGVPKSIASFVLPLGTTINMNGTAIFQGIASVFIAQAYGIELSFTSQLVIVVSATFAAVGCAGIPGGALVTLSIVLSSVGLPVEGIAIVAGIDRLRDIISTVLNVLGEGVTAVYVAKTEGELDEAKYNSGVYVSYEQKKAAEVPVAEEA